MKIFGRAGLRLALVGTSALAMSVVAATPAAAQLTTATVRGRVLTASNAPAANVRVIATSVGTGSVSSATTDANGSYTLTGLSPGEYRFQASSDAGASSTQLARLQVGQTATLDMTLATETAAADTIIVVGNLIETKTSEVATNVTREQIENLPQNNRNFLNFAALAPGVRVSNNETRRTFAGGGISADPNGESLASPQVNVFIDGVSLKSNIQQGGLVGQDGSRGNPFSQLAVQEFRVLTSNFKAEYEDAGTSIITAITKSGTNEFHGDAFFTYQDDSMIERDSLQRRENQAKPDLKRYQFGAALGGPIIKDNLFFFLTYEANLQDRAATVIPGGDAARQAEFESASGLELDQFRGTFASPFREHLGFGKLTWQIADNQLFELTGSVRIESDLRDFGNGNTARERGTDIQNDTYTARARHQYTSNAFINEATIDYLRSDLTFGSAVGDVFGRNYQGVINIGGRPDFQDITQEGITFRDNVSFTDFNWNGDHLVKAGVKISRQKYRIGGSGPFANPLFNFNIDATQNLDFSFPAEVNFGAGDPNISANTTQIGLFVQDDWAIDDHLTLNLGLRWDYDSNSKNNNYVTPDDAAEALRALGQDPRIGNFFDVEDYISTGDRDAPLNQFQPRIGFSYDLNADQKTVFFGGFGRYYDRALFRNAAEESLFRQFRRGNLQFSSDGLPRNGQPTIQFQDSYLTPEGFDALLASLAADPSSPGTSELRVIPNNLKSPYTDQFSIGVRQRFGPVRTSLSYSHIIGKHQIGYAPLNRTEATNANGFLDFIPLINGFSNAVAAFNTRATRYDAVYVTVDKPYTESSGWGAGIAYTLAYSKERGFPFNFDFPNIDARPFVPNAGDERHHLVVNGIADLFWGLKLSGLATIGSGVPFSVIDASKGFGARDIRFPGNVGDVPMFVQVDLRLQKEFKVMGNNALTVSAEVFNLFDRTNVGAAEGFIPPGGNADFGRPNFPLAGPPRSFQFGAAFSF